LRKFAFDAIGPYALAGATLTAGFDQATNTPPEWQQGLVGYSERFGSDLGIGVVGTATRYGLAADGLPVSTRRALRFAHHRSKRGIPLEHHRREMSKSERADRVKELLAEVGLERGFEKMPSDISGGMQKRVGLARALALEPKTLLLDEPTAGLDPISSGEINDLILKLQRERQMASIVVTHDLHSARTIVDRLAILNEGRILIEGSFEDLERSDIEFVKTFLKQS
jgi:ABC-type dipeptide/oligopeptide/nickel transport system ATPase subunit